MVDRWQTLVAHPLLGLLVLATFGHVAWLSFPREVVFDEVHFGKFVTAYCCTKERFFDIHPPHAKLLIAGTAYLGGYRGGVSFENIGQSYGTVSPLPLRFFPALTGIALVGVIFLLLQQLGAGKAAAFLGGLAVLLDNALTVQTRIIALDGLLLVGTFGSLMLYLAAQKRLQSGLVRQALWFGIGAGILAGLAVGTKFTGLVALGLIGLLVGVKVLATIRSGAAVRWVSLGSVILLSAFVVYTAGWAIHFALLQEPGPGDDWRVPEWRRPLWRSFIFETVELHKIMYEANSGLQAGHQDASAWWTWPLMKTPVFYWQSTPEASSGHRLGSIYFLGNPAVWWGISLLAFTAFVSVAWQGLSVFLAAGLRSLARRLRDFVVSVGSLWIPLIGYGMAYLPLLRVPRALFLYHYLTALLFSLLFVLVWLERVGWIKPIAIRNQRPSYFIVIGILVAFFIVFSPLTYGFLLDPELHQRLFWLSTWR